MDEAVSSDWSLQHYLVFSAREKHSIAAVHVYVCIFVWRCAVECQKVSVPIRPPHLIDQVISRSIAS